MYKVICRFADLQDESHVYEVGDTYPRKGVKPSEERISELMGDSNKIGRPLIEKVSRPKSAKKVVQTEKKPPKKKAED